MTHSPWRSFLALLALTNAYGLDHSVILHATLRSLIPLKSDGTNRGCPALYVHKWRTHSKYSNTALFW